MLSVAATDLTDNLANFSSYGAKSVQLAAPGVGILSTTPNSSYAVLNGTSMAAPHVTGVVALVWGLHPTWSYTQVIAQILNTVDPLPSLQGKTTTGGRLDAAAAVGWTATVTPPVPAAPPVKVVSLNVIGTVTNTLDEGQVTFNRAINPASFTAGDVAILRPDGSTINPYSLVAVAGSNNTKFNFFFTSQTVAGVYHVTIGPALVDPVGVSMATALSLSYTIYPSVTAKSTAPATIPGPFAATSRVQVKQNLTILSVTVQVNLTFPRDGNLSLHLIAPDNTDILLSNYQGGTARTIRTRSSTIWPPIPFGTGRPPSPAAISRRVRSGRSPARTRVAPGPCSLSTALPGW